MSLFSGETIANPKIIVDGSQQAAIASLTDNSTGTAGSAVADAGASYTQATIDNNFATLTAKVNALIAVLKSAGITA